MKGDFYVSETSCGFLNEKGVVCFSNVDLYYTIKDKSFHIDGSDWFTDQKEKYTFLISTFLTDWD